MVRNEFGARHGRRWGRFLPALVAAVGLGTLGAREAAAGTLLVSSTGTTGQVLRYHAQFGTPSGVLILPGSGGMSSVPQHLMYGKDGNVYVSDYNNNTILRFDMHNGDFRDVVVPPGSGGLSLPTDLALGPDGHLYVCSRGTHQVLKYNGHTGAFIGVFVPAGSGGLSQPDAMAFGPDGNLYVTGQGNTRVIKYNGTTGALIGSFTPSSGAGLLSVPVALRFGPDGNLYVASNGTHEVLKFNGSTGAFISSFAAVADPLDIAFGPDGHLYAADHTSDSVLKFDGATGVAMGTHIVAGSNGLDVPHSLVFLPPNTPMGLTPAMVTGTSIILSWQDMSDDESNFTVWRRSPSFDWAPVATLPAGTVSYTNSGLIPGIPYAYRVTASNALGASEPTQIVPVITPGPLPPVPGEVHAWAISPGQVFVGWMPHGGPVLGYAIWRKGGGSDWTQAILLMNAQAAGWIDTGLKHDTEYLYRVRAIGPNGTSDWSEEVYVRTPSPSLSAPSSLAGTPVSSTRVNLTWSLPAAGGETNVQIWRQLGSGAFVKIATLAAGTTSYADLGVTAGNSYTYQVRIGNSYYVSPYSNQVSVTMP